LPFKRIPVELLEEKIYFHVLNTEVIYLKGIVQQNAKVLSLFTQPHSKPDFCFSAKHKKEMSVLY